MSWKYYRNCRDVWWKRADNADDTAIVRAKIVSPIGDTVGLINHEQADARFGFDQRTASLIVIASGKLHTKIRHSIAVLDQPMK